MTARGLVLIVLVLAAAPFVRATDPAPVPLRAPLSALPARLDSWRGVDGPDVEPEVAAVLGADDYLNRIYRQPEGAAVGLWVAYYGAQRQGDAIHSPMNCLPGTGWTPIAHSRPLVRAGGQIFPVNRYVVEKRGDRQVVMYWFQGRGRTIANEYANKAYLLVDALRMRRTDGALVRVIAPVADDERLADLNAGAFIGVLHPQLTRWLP